jgi:CubicO group peptidase (beta-lactamase class C family)
LALLAIVICAAVVMSGARSSLARAAERATPRDAIARFVRATIPKRAPATLVAARDGRIVACLGVGLADRAGGRQAGCGTGYDICSMTKQFTAAAILKLQMLGRLSVEDRIGKYVGPVPADKREITIHDLLTQTSGLRAQLGGDYQPVSRNRMLRRAMRSKLRSAPGSTYHYSNLGYSVLAAIVERASGMDYERFLTRELFRPAGMRRTGYVLPDWKRARVAVEYDARGRSHGRPFDHRWAADGPYWNLRGNGGMLSTARDLFRWYRALRGDQVLDADAKSQLFHPRVSEGTDSGSYYGYGWSILPATPFGSVATHDGGNGLTYGRLTMLRDRDAMVFWISNRVRRRGHWNLTSVDQPLTIGVAGRLLASG